MHTFLLPPDFHTYHNLCVEGPPPPPPVSTSWSPVHLLRPISKPTFLKELFEVSTTELTSAFTIFCLAHTLGGTHLRTSHTAQCDAL